MFVNNSSIIRQYKLNGLFNNSRDSKTVGIVISTIDKIEV